MTDQELVAATDLVLRGDDRETAAELAMEIGKAVIREMASVYAKHLLQAEVTPTTMHVSRELLAMLAPKAPEVTVQLHQPEQPKRTKRTTVTEHDERGRIVAFETEDV
jgi:hypothetical protein